MTNFTCTKVTNFPLMFYTNWATYRNSNTETHCIPSLILALIYGWDIWRVVTSNYATCFFVLWFSLILFCNVHLRFLQESLDDNDFRSRELWWGCFFSHPKLHYLWLDQSFPLGVFLVLDSFWCMGPWIQITESIPEKSKEETQSRKFDAEDLDIQFLANRKKKLIRDF